MAKVKRRHVVLMAMLPGVYGPAIGTGDVICHPEETSGTSGTTDSAAAMSTFLCEDDAFLTEVHYLEDEWVEGISWECSDGETSVYYGDTDADVGVDYGTQSRLNGITMVRSKAVTDRSLPYMGQFQLHGYDPDPGWVISYGG